MDDCVERGLKRNISSSESEQDLFLSDESACGESSCSSRRLPACKYGADCYRRNPEHFESYSHPSDVGNVSNNNRSSRSPKRQKSLKGEAGEMAVLQHTIDPFRFCLLKVSSINHAHNSMFACGIKGIYLT